MIPRPTLRATVPAALLAVCLVGETAVTPVLAEDGVTLRLLHTNDVHARYDVVTRHGSPCGIKARSADDCLGGAARLASLASRLRTKANHSLLLDAGDQFQGTLFYTRYKAEAPATILPLIGYDAMAVGNHEFDDGPVELGRLAASMDVPVLSANLDVSDDPSLRGGPLEKHHLFDVDGVPVGVFGLTTPDTVTQSTPGPTVRFRDPVTTARAEVEVLTGQGADIIIALTHLGYRADLDLAARVDGVDVVIGGHSHTVLGDGPDAAGPYPTVVASPSGAPVLVVQAGALGLALGALDVTFDANGIPTGWSGGLVSLDASIPEDPQVAAVVATLTQPLAEMRAQPVGALTADLEGDRGLCRFQDCGMGAVITAAMLEATPDESITIALMNGGGIRAGLPAGPVTLGQVLEVLPFGNTLATFKIEGRYLRAALEHAVSVADDPEANGTGRFLQVDGLRVTWDPSMPGSRRLRSVQARNSAGAWAPLVDETVYGVATNNFVRNGGDGYAMFRDHAIAPYDYGPSLDAMVADYLAERSPFTLTSEPRITRMVAE